MSRFARLIRPCRAGSSLALVLFLGACPGGQVEGRAATPAAAPAPAPAAAADAPLPAPAPPKQTRGKKLLAEATSPFSKIRVQQQGKRRTLGFVRQRGDEYVQTIVDLDHPDDAAHPYAENMAAPFLAVTEPRRLLMIGLGGGSLVRMFHSRLPAAVLDVVEIDPEVVKLAAEWFGVIPGPRLNLATDDGAQFILAEGDAYDIIWLDAFLVPGDGGTDIAGFPEPLRRRQFHERVRARLRPGGVVAFNIHHVSGYHEHVDAIACTFPKVYIARPPDANEWIVIAGEADLDLGPAVLAARAAALDADPRWRLPFTRIAGTIGAWERTTPAEQCDARQ